MAHFQRNFVSNGINSAYYKLPFFFFQKSSTHDVYISYSDLLSYDTVQSGKCCFHFQAADTACNGTCTWQLWNAPLWQHLSWLLLLFSHPHLPPTLQKEYSYTSTPPLSLHGNLQDELYLYLYSFYSRQQCTTCAVTDCTATCLSHGNPISVMLAIFSSFCCSSHKPSSALQSVQHRRRTCRKCGDFDGRGTEQPAASVHVPRNKLTDHCTV